MCDRTISQAHIYPIKKGECIVVQDIDASHSVCFGRLMEKLKKIC